ncbi:hypothetical protein F511_35780 [Dorcoceras hygrometricum]|uniref:Uncharacterized protein n=1 Tax=Dorcoceras hygrometricum TaxID=472368 RepID=A0A2Z7DG13_9LAMI|nr:hypothetical protein F511_35780 [Dorcoceras hygrometricum]
MFSNWFTINVQQLVWRRPKRNQLEHNQPADDEDQLQALKSKVNQLKFSRKTLRCYFSRRSYSASSCNAKISSRKESAGSNSTSSRELICISCCYSTSRKLCIFSRLGSQAQRIEEGAKRSSRRVKSAAKQLTKYQSWMSTAELISKWRKRQKPAKEKGRKYFYFTEERCTKMERRQDSLLER